MKRETQKDFEFEGRHWIINKFDAMTGSYVAYRLMAEVLPMGIAAKVGIPMPMGGKIMSKTDFFELQRDCLMACAENLSAGHIPVMNEEGNFGVVGLENDAKTVMILTIQVLTWNMADFFDEKLWTSLVQSFQGLKLPTAPTSMNTSSPQS
jgi:hypothetical protein